MKTLLIVICCLALTGLASAQASVEGALTHGLSAGAGATAGKALGQIGDQLAGRVAQQTSRAVSPRVTTVHAGTQKAVKVPQAATPTAPITNGGSLIASIEGGEQQTSPCASTAKAPGDQKQTACKNTGAGDKDAHPSEITLPASK